MAAYLPTVNMGMVRMTREIRTTTTHALYATLLTQSKLSPSLVDSNSSVLLVSWNFLQSVGFSDALRVYFGKVLRANSTSMPVKRKAELIVQPEKFTPELGIVFLISTVDTFHCPLGLDFVTKNVCLLYAEEQRLFRGKKRKRLQLNPKPTTRALTWQ